MRTHRITVAARPWVCGRGEITPDALAVVRVEGVSRQRKGTLAIDAFFAVRDGIAVVPAVLVDAPMLVARERDALIWPDGIADLAGDAELAAVEERVVAALAPRVRALERIVEDVIRFAEAPLFERARAAGAYGAAPYRESLARLAPYLYARRLCGGRRVLIDAADAPGGARVLTESAIAIHVAEPRLDVTAQWYGIAGAAQPFDADVAILDGGATSDAPSVVRLDASAGERISATVPFPLDVAPSFDPREGPPARVFTIERAVEPRLRQVRVPAPAVAGGSSGRIRIVVGRRDASRRPGADSDEAEALAAMLRTEGFDAELVAAAAQVADADLVHLFGTREGAFAREVVDAARERRVPVAVHAFAEDVVREGYWGTAVARFCFEYGPDERSVAEYLGLLARRLVAIGALTAGSPYVDPRAHLDDARRALTDASLVFVQSQDEAQLLERLGVPVRPIVVPPLLGADRPAAPIGARVGADPFVFVHAPIGPEGNQLLVARALADAELPLVVAGPVGDASYLERVREFGGSRLIVLPEPDPATATALYAAAAVYVDAGWIGYGLSRIARASVSGCEIVVANRRLCRELLPPGARTADPADAGALARAIGEAWDAAIVRRGELGETARYVAPRVEPSAALRAIVGGYAGLAAAVA